VRPTLVDEPAVQQGKVARILAHDRPTLGRAGLEYIAVRPSAKSSHVGDGHRVVALAAQDFGDVAIMLLIEQQPQRRAAFP